MQKAVDLWEESMKTTGGAILPNKCYRYVVDFKWKDLEWDYVTSSELPAILTVEDTNGIQQPMKRLDINDPCKESKVLLGVQCEPFGKMLNQVEIMLEK